MAMRPAAAWCHGHLRMPFAADDVAAMVRKVFADRVQFHDGTDELAPGITIHLVGGHSCGLQIVRVKTRRDFVVLAAGATDLDNDFEERRVYAIIDIVARVLEGCDLLERITTSRRQCDSRTRSGHALIGARLRAGASRLGSAARRRAETPVIDAMAYRRHRRRLERGQTCFVDIASAS
jgi:hypothetical protein